MSPTETELREYFEHYGVVFHGDLGQFCALYHEPSTTVRLDGSVHHLPTRAEAHEFFTNARQVYEATGCRRWEIRGLCAQALGTRSVAATLDWAMLTADGAFIRGWRQTYNLVRSENGWLVVHSTLHSGSER